ncbi:MAG: hypothetical protein M3O23_05605 [Actinomycetota bacterium]|nr:hypothetical protein [Actinomycetota bacterium]
MSGELLRRLRALEGRRVHLCLADGSRLDDVALVSVGRGTIWVFGGGEDTFVRTGQVRDFWEARPLSSAA